MMKDTDRYGCIAASVIRPSDVASQNVLGTLQPLETNNGCSRCFWVASLNRCFGETVDLVAGSCRLDSFSLWGFCHPAPWVLNVLVEDVGIKPMHHAPSTCAQPDNLFALARSRPART